jgi:hypothetical protein
LFDAFEAIHKTREEYISNCLAGSYLSEKSAVNIYKNNLEVIHIDFSL